MESSSRGFVASGFGSVGAWLTVVLVVGASLFWTVHPWYDPTNDGSMYIATARSLAAGEGYRYLGIPFLIRPPGFSAMLAPLLALRGNDFFALNLFVSLWGALGVVVFHFHLRERLGLVLATVVPLVLWFNPGYQRLCNQVMSDVPGWTLLVSCLWLLSRRGRRSTRGALLLGLAIGLASLVRSGNLLLVPAVLLADFLREWMAAKDSRRWPSLARQSGLLVLGAVLTLAPWSLRNRMLAEPPPADQTLLYSYSSGMWHEDMGDPRSPRVPLEQVLARLPIQTSKGIHTLGTRLEEGPRTFWTPLVGWGLIAVLILAALRRRAAEEWLALGTLLVVAFYFGYAGRLLLPVFALALAAFAELLMAGCSRLAGRRGASAMTAGVLLLWLGLDWSPRESWDQIEELHEAYEESALQILSGLPAEARLGAYRGWHHGVYLERPVYSFEQACERAGNTSASLEIIEKYGLDTVLLTPLGLPQPVAQAERACAAYLAERFGGRKLGLVRVR